MSELFLELFSEEIPSGLQKNAREGILKLFIESFDKLNISFDESKIHIFDFKSKKLAGNLFNIFIVLAPSK